MISRQCGHARVAPSVPGRAALTTLLNGPTAVALGTSDEVDLARGLIDETRTFKTLKIVGGFLGGRLMSADI